MERELTLLPSADIELVPGAGGIFDVTVGDKNIFSKKQLNRFPVPGEISKLIEKL